MTPIGSRVGSAPIGSALVALTLLVGACANLAPQDRTLLSGDDPFALERAVQRTQHQPERTLAEAIVSARTRDGDAARAPLQHWLDANPSAPPQDRELALIALADVAGREGRYAEAARLLGAVNESRGGTDQHNSISTAFWTALSGQEQLGRAPGASGGSVSLVRDRGDLLRAPVMIAGQTVHMIVDTGAEVSVLTRSHADAAGMRSIAGEVTVGTSTAPAQFDLRMADRIEIGGVVVEHVPFIVQPDEAMTFADGAYKIDGILGAPVLRALERVAWLERGAVLAFGDAVPGAGPNTGRVFWHDMGLGLEVEFRDGRAPAQLDTGANETELSELGLRMLGGPNAVRLQTASRIEEGLGGKNTIETRRTGEVEFNLAGRPVGFDALDVRASEGEAPVDAARIGGDVLLQLDAFILDFDAMRYEAR